MFGSWFSSRAPFRSCSNGFKGGKKETGFFVYLFSATFSFLCRVGMKQNLSCRFPFENAMASKRLSWEAND